MVTFPNNAPRAPFPRQTIIDTSPEPLGENLSMPPTPWAHTFAPHHLVPGGVPGRWSRPATPTQLRCMRTALRHIEAHVMGCLQLLSRRQMTEDTLRGKAKRGRVVTLAVSGKVA